MPGVSNYLIGNDKSKWHTGIANYAEVQFSSVYPGIDLVYYGNQRQLEHDFVVAPGADPKKIRLSFEGAKGLSISDKGDLNVELEDGNTIQLTNPVVYQTINDKKVSVKGSYALHGKNQVGFKLASYDKRHALTIDPLLLYSTYLGGSGTDEGNGIAVDSNGNAYVTGQTTGGFPTPDFPTHNPEQPTYGGGLFDAFVTKINPEGSALVYSTYLGGSAEDEGFGIAVDSAGQAYVVGQTASGTGDFPSGTKGYNTTYSGGFFDAFLVVLDASGASLIYSTFLGGGGTDAGNAIAIGASGFAYVTGTTLSGDFPTTTGAYQTMFNGGSSSGASDAFIAKLDITVTSTPSLIYSTYLGGGDSDNGNGIAVDASGSAYIVGDTFSCGVANPAFPTTASAFQSSCVNGSQHAFVSRLNSIGTALLYSTFLGGNNFDHGAGIAIDTADQIYVTGNTESTNLRTSPGAFQAAYAGNTDAFAAKFNPLASGSASLIYLTYLGGSANDAGNAIAVDSSGGAVVTGVTSSGDLVSGNFPTTPDTLPYGGVEDAFLARLNALGSAISYSTYLGGNSIDAGSSVVVDADGSAYVTGVTASTNFPHTAASVQYPQTERAFQTSLGLSESNPTDDAFITKFSGTTPVQATFFYQATPQSGTHGPFADSITLQDRFGIQTGVKVKIGTDFGLPIATEYTAGDHNDITTDVLDETGHFVNYRITATTVTPLIAITDEFFPSPTSPLELLLHGGISLMVPAFERAPFIDPNTPPLTAKQHYRCYDVNAALPGNSGVIDGNGEIINSPFVSLFDNELAADIAVYLVKPRRYCVAVKVSSDDGIYDSDIASTANNLMCYETVRVDGPSAPAIKVDTLDQFGPSVFNIVNNNLLCMPSTIVPIPSPG